MFFDGTKSCAQGGMVGGRGVKNLSETLRKMTERFFFDRCQVIGLEEKECDWGETRREKKVVYEEIPCRLVQEAKGMQKDGLLWGTEKEALLLFPIWVRIQAGSQVVVTTEEGREVTFIAAGEESYFSTHKEIKLSRDEKA